MVAMINGHAFAGGFFLALAHDYRVMREDRGFMCPNSASLGIPIPKGLTDFALCKLSHSKYSAMSLLSQRFGSEEAIEAGLAHYAFEKENIFEETVKLALEKGT